MFTRKPSKETKKTGTQATTGGCLMRSYASYKIAKEIATRSKALMKPASISLR